MPYRKETKTDPSTKHTTKFEYAIAWMLEHLAVCAGVVVACTLLPLMYEYPRSISGIGIVVSLVGGFCTAMYVSEMSNTKDGALAQAKKRVLMFVGVVFIGALFLAGGFVHRQYFEEAPEPRPAPKCKVHKSK